MSEYRKLLAGLEGKTAAEQHQEIRALAESRLPADIPKDHLLARNESAFDAVQAQLDFTWQRRCVLLLSLDNWESLRPHSLSAASTYKVFQDAVRPAYDLLDTAEKLTFRDANHVVPADAYPENCHTSLQGMTAYTVQPASAFDLEKEYPHPDPANSSRRWANAAGPKSVGGVQYAEPVTEKPGHYRRVYTILQPHLYYTLNQFSEGRRQLYQTAEFRSTLEKCMGYAGIAEPLIPELAGHLIEKRLDPDRASALEKKLGLETEVGKADERTFS